MRVVATVIVRDEADIIGAQITYHLGAGVDFVIAVDHESRDGTTDILESFARDGVLRRLARNGPVDEVAWRTEMARLAVLEHRADWVVPADADEFWLPRYGTLRETLTGIPAHAGVVGGQIRHFVPRPEDGRTFAERMTVRLTMAAPVNDPTSPWRPSPKVLFRADRDVTVLHAGYAVQSAVLSALPGWNLFDVLHFPCRSSAQWGRKTSRRSHAGADKALGQYVKGQRASTAGSLEDLFACLVVDDAGVAAGIAAGTMAEDTRLRDALRGQPQASEPSPPSLVAAAVDSTGLFDAMLVRCVRRLDDAAVRVAALEEVRSGGARRR